MLFLTRALYILMKLNRSLADDVELVLKTQMQLIRVHALGDGIDEILVRFDR